jgi:hypothetical protein
MEALHLLVTTSAQRRVFVLVKNVWITDAHPMKSVSTAQVVTAHHNMFLNDKHFWRPAVITVIALSAFFAWELGFLGDLLPRLPRPEATVFEIYYTLVLIALLTLDSGLVFFRLKKGTCPVGAKRASTLAGGLGVVTLLCPACLLLPISIFGLGLSLSLLAPYLPLLRAIVLLLLIVSTLMLWPKNASQK